jgi:hypothetical protein
MSSQHGLYIQGHTHATMAGTMGRQTVRWSQSSKAGLSSDCGLQPAHMKLELLVTAGQLYCGEYVPGDCTHRPSRHGSWQHLKPVGQPQGGSRRRWGW